MIFLFTDLVNNGYKQVGSASAAFVADEGQSETGVSLHARSTD